MGSFRSALHRNKLSKLTGTFLAAFVPFRFTQPILLRSDLSQVFVMVIEPPCSASIVVLCYACSCGHHNGRVYDSSLISDGLEMLYHSLIQMVTQHKWPPSFGSWKCFSFLSGPPPLKCFL